MLPLVLTAANRRRCSANLRSFGGNCNGCGTHFLPQHLTVDHIVARSKGGTNHLDNLQLLCGHCNFLKGNHPMEYLRARLVGGCVNRGFSGLEWNVGD